MKKLYTIILLAFISTITNAQYTKLLDFTGANGSNPNDCSLVTDGTFFYGVTYSGGTNSFGVLFKIKDDGTGYTKLLDFAGTTTGKYPRGSLYLNGSTLYGMTSQGGTNLKGIIYKINTNGTGYAKLLDFSGATNGAFPYSSFIYSSTYLYGMTSQGGTNNLGVIFRIKTDGSNDTILHHFTGAGDGSSPCGTLISDGTFLYGMTSSGGNGGYGTIFKIKTDGTGYSKILDFNNASNGAAPFGSLFSDGTFLYGMTSQGGINSLGVCFKIKPNGTGFVKLLDFSGTTNGSYANASFISCGAFLYGTTYNGGTNSLGVIFKIKPDGTGYAKLLDFSGTVNGSNPRGSLIANGAYLFGLTQSGGANSLGTIFKYQYCTPVTFSQSPTVCLGQSVIVGSHTYTAGATYHDTLTAVSGCDSIVTTNLTVLPANSYTQSPTVCAGDSITVGTHLYNTNGMYIDTLMAYNGCDSVVTTNVTVLPANIFTQSPIVCSGQNIMVGSNTYTISGIYHDTLIAANTCDSIVTTNLTVLTAITNSVTIVPATCGSNNGSVSLNPSGGAGNYTFLWGNNITASIVTGLSGLPIDTLIVTITDASGCTLSDTAIVSCVTGLSQNTTFNFTIFPNPSNGIFTIRCSAKNSEFEIINVLGEKIYSSNNSHLLNGTSQKTEIDLSREPSGIYFIQVKFGENTISRKLIIE